MRRFIAFYRLDTDQIKKARQHHALCVGGYHDYMKEHDAEVRKLKAEIEDLSKKKEKSRADEETLAHHRKRIGEIDGYADQVFDERLRPGLLRISTDKQVEAAKAAAARLSATIRASQSPDAARAAANPTEKK